MKGTIQVGEDAVPISFKGRQDDRQGQAGDHALHAAGGGVVTGKLTGPKPKRREGHGQAGRRREGQPRLVERGLKPGSYKGTLTFVDDFDEKTVKKVSFKIAE